MSPWRRVCVAGGLAASCTMLAGCDRSTGGSTAGPPLHSEPGQEAIAAIPLGDVAGAASVSPVVPNPYHDNAQAARQGRELFVRMNCAGCHGYGAKGGMGPNLTDGYWRYGGVPVSIYKSIYEGRPQGMPAWNPALPPQEIWKLVAYIQSLGGSYPADEYQAALQGDRAGQNVPPDVSATVPASAEAREAPKPAGGKSGPPSVAPNPDISPAPGTGK